MKGGDRKNLRMQQFTDFVISLTARFSVWAIEQCITPTYQIRRRQRKGQIMKF